MGHVLDRGVLGDAVSFADVVGGNTTGTGTGLASTGAVSWKSWLSGVAGLASNSHSASAAPAFARMRWWPARTTISSRSSVGPYAFVMGLPRNGVRVSRKDVCGLSTLRVSLTALAFMVAMSWFTWRRSASSMSETSITYRV